MLLQKKNLLIESNFESICNKQNRKKKRISIELVFIMVVGEAISTPQLELAISPIKKIINK